MRRIEKQRQLPDNLSYMKTKKTKTTDSAATNIPAFPYIVETEGREIEIPGKPGKKLTKKQAKRFAKKQAKKPPHGTGDAFQLEQYRALCNEIPVETIGIDLGDRSHRLCVTDRLGMITEERAIENDRLAVSALARQHPNARFVMEVGTHSPWISALLRELGCEVIVGNARKLKAISEHERKSDELDARTLAKIGRMDIDLLYPVNHVSQDALKDRLIISSRENLVNTRKRTIQSVRGSVKALGLRIESCGAEVFPGRARKSLAGENRVLSTIEPLLKCVETMNESIAELDAKLATLSAEKYPETAILQQVAGVGPITAIAFVLAIEDPNRIDITRNIGAYFGLVPGRDQSGESDPQKGISKTGNDYIRKLLTQCAQYILGEHGPDCDLRGYGLRRAAKGGDTKKAAKGAKKKAITAVARKLAVLLLSLWKSGATYEPLRHSTEAAAA
jgi:transposase